MREKSVHLARRRWQVAGPLRLQTERTRPSLSPVPTADLDPGRDSHQRCPAAATIRYSPANRLSQDFLCVPASWPSPPPKSLFAGQVLEESASAPLGKKLGVLKGEQFLFAQLDEPVVHRDRLRQQDLVSLVVCGSLGRFQTNRRNILCQPIYSRGVRVRERRGGERPLRDPFAWIEPLNYSVARVAIHRHSPRYVWTRVKSWPWYATITIVIKIAKAP